MFGIYNNVQRYINKHVCLSYFAKVKCRRLYSNNALDVNTNVAKDVILFKYDKPKFFRYLNIFGFSQFVFWTYLSHFAYTTLRDAPIEKKEGDPWWKAVNLGENKYKNGISLLCFLLGWTALLISWVYTLRSVRYLILRKGGKQITIITYTLVGNKRMFTIDVTDVSCKEMRTAAKSQLPIKAKKHMFHYILDMRGEFRNPTLFDHTAGLKRTW